MKIILSSHEILNKETSYIEILRKIERIGRTAYQSYDKKTHDSYKSFIKMLISRGHESVLEHGSISVKAIIDRGISHELVRHRIASYTQESTRYINYNKKEIEFILPSIFYPLLDEMVLIDSWLYDNEVTLKEALERGHKPVYYINKGVDDKLVYKLSVWLKAIRTAEESYTKLIGNKMSPQFARSVLPNSLKTEIIITMNLRSWRHFFKLRCDKTAHPDMRIFAINLLKDMKTYLPIIFDDIKEDN